MIKALAKDPYKNKGVQHLLSGLKIILKKSGTRKRRKW